MPRLRNLALVGAAGIAAFLALDYSLVIKRRCSTEAGYAQSMFASARATVMLEQFRGGSSRGLREVLDSRIAENRSLADNAIIAVMQDAATAEEARASVEAWCLAQAQHMGVPLVDFAILMPPVMLVVALPISAGGWGVREGAIVAALALTGVGTAPALLLSVELGLIGTLVSLPGGVIWLRRCLSRLNRNARDT